MLSCADPLKYHLVQIKCVGVQSSGFYNGVMNPLKHQSLFLDSGFKRRQSYTLSLLPPT